MPSKPRVLVSEAEIKVREIGAKVIEICEKRELCGGAKNAPCKTCPMRKSVKHKGIWPEAIENIISMECDNDQATIEKVKTRLIEDGNLFHYPGWKEGTIRIVKASKDTYICKYGWPEPCQISVKKISADQRTEFNVIDRKYNVRVKGVSSGAVCDAEKDAYMKYLAEYPCNHEVIAGICKHCELYIPWWEPKVKAEIISREQIIRWMERYRDYDDSSSSSSIVINDPSQLYPRSFNEALFTNGIEKKTIIDQSLQEMPEEISKVLHYRYREGIHWKKTIDKLKIPLKRYYALCNLGISYMYFNVNNMETEKMQLATEFQKQADRRNQIICNLAQNGCKSNN